MYDRSVGQLVPSRLVGRVRRDKQYGDREIESPNPPLDIFGWLDCWAKTRPQCQP